MSFGDHLDELRRRLILAIVGVAPIFVLSLFVAGPVLEVLVGPVTEAMRDAGESGGLQATGPLETFLAYLKVAVLLTLLVALPWILLQAWLFIAPGLYAAERRFAYVLLPMSAVLTVLSAVFLYFVLLPISLQFLIFFGSSIATTSTPAAEAPPAVVEQLAAHQLPVLDRDPTPEQLGALGPGASWVHSERRELRVHVGDGRVMSLRLRGEAIITQEYRVGEYIGLVLRLALVFAVAFQLPMVLMLLSWVGIVEARDLSPYRRQVVFACGVVGAVFTPQDPWSMIALGGALYLLFELGLVLMRFVPASAVAGDAERRSAEWTDGDLAPDEDEPFGGRSS